MIGQKLFTMSSMAKNNLEKICIKNIKSNTQINDSIEKLCEKYNGIFYKVVSKYFNKNNWKNFSQPIDSDFVFQSKYSIFYETARSFDPDRGVKFGSHLYNKVRFFCLKEISKLKLNNDFYTVSELEIDKEVFLDSSDKQKKDEFQVICKNIMLEIGKMSDKRLYHIFHLRYFYLNGDIMTWNLVSEKLKSLYGYKLTGQACINLHNKIINNLKLEKKEKYIF